MKKVLFFSMLLVAMLGAAQNTKVAAASKSEVSFNVLDLLVAGTADVGYERFLGGSQSLAVGVSLFDTFGYYDINEMDKSTGFSARVAYNVYFSSRKECAGLYVYPMAKVRSGSVTVNEYYYLSNEQGMSVVDGTYSYDLNSFSLGIGAGYKWVIRDSFTLNMFANLSRNIGGYDDMNLSVLELRTGVSLGYRF